jgi:hypothetical protein
MAATKVAVVVPYRAGEPHRDAAWAAIEAHYAIHHPEWPLIVADCPGEWAKGAAVNAAVKRTKAGVIVIADADSFVPPEILAEAVEVAPKAGWVVPHITVHRLDEASTARFLAGEPGPYEWQKKPYEGLAGGGIVVLTRKAFDTVSGMDERFLHWGSEDISFGLALETLVGPHHRLFGELWHLWHPYVGHPNIVPAVSDELVHRYHAARHHPGQMRAVIAGETYRKPPLQTQMVRFRIDRDRFTVFCGSERARFRNHVLDTRDPDLIEALRMIPTVEEVSP